jgi:fucose 4-O-acetylase-like acetyltransferase
MAIGKAYERVGIIDRSAGIAIVLVVFGHMYFPEIRSIHWYMVAHDFVYKIHMPLFMYLSGFVAFMATSKISISGALDYKVFVLKKLKKFLPPYIILPLISFGVDYFIYKRSIALILSDVNAWIFYPINGSAEFVWYLYVLFGFYLLTPMLLGVDKKILYLLLFAGFFLTNISGVSRMFSSDLFARYFFFFITGGVSYMNYDLVKGYVENKGWLFVLLFLFLIFIDIYIGGEVPFQLISVVFIVAVLYISSLSWFGKDVLAYIGRASFAIYLFNAIALNILYLFLKNVFDYDFGWEFVCMGVLIGVLGPLFIRFILNNYFLKKIYRL